MTPHQQQSRPDDTATTLVGDSGPGSRSALTRAGLQISLAAAGFLAVIALGTFSTVGLVLAAVLAVPVSVLLLFCVAAHKAVRRVYDDGLVFLSTGEYASEGDALIYRLAFLPAALIDTFDQARETLGDRRAGYFRIVAGRDGPFALVASDRKTRREMRAAR